MIIKNGFLIHHGVKGQKWGVWNEDTRARYNGGRKHVSSATRENLLASKTANIEKWGQDSKHNVLYIAGLSGSGKSVTAEGLRDKNVNTIHLDYYLEKGNNRSSFRDPEFTSYLEVNAPEVLDVLGSKSLSDMTKEEKNEYWKCIDKFENSIKSFGVQQHGLGKKVVCEGVQLVDDTLFPDKKYFKDQPIVILSTDADTALQRGLDRDEIGVDDADTIAIRTSYQKIWSTYLDDLSNTAEAKVGEEYVMSLLRKHKEVS